MASEKLYRNTLGLRKLPVTTRCQQQISGGLTAVLLLRTVAQFLALN